MKALEVSINGKVVGLYVPPKGECFSVMLGNIPRTHMRAQVHSGDKREDWYWQLPDIQEQEAISFRLVDAVGRKGVPPQRRVPVDPVGAKETKKAAAKAWAAAKKQMGAKGRI
jgi:hypothetical protein